MIQTYDHITTDAYNSFLNTFELQEYFNKHNVIFTTYSPRDHKLTVEVKNVSQDDEQYIFDMCWYHLVKACYSDINKNARLYGYEN